MCEVGARYELDISGETEIRWACVGTWPKDLNLSSVRATKLVTLTSYFTSSRFSFHACQRWGDNFCPVVWNQ